MLLHVQVFIYLSDVLTVCKSSVFLTLPLVICRKQSARKEDLKLKFKYQNKIGLVGDRFSVIFVYCAN